MGRPGLLQSALSTANAVEMLLSRGNGTVLALDELALMRGEDQGRLIFEIYSGTGKQRMRAEGGLREVASWRTFALLSNEKKLSDSVREADRPRRAGPPPAGGGDVRGTTPRVGL